MESDPTSSVVTEHTLEEHEARETALTEHDRLILEDMREPATQILRQLKPEIESGAYQMIIGDDASGRLPTLLIAKVIRSVCEAYGNAMPAVRFVAGTKSYDEGRSHSEFAAKKSAVDDYVDELINKDPNIRRVLLVTDTIASGRSLVPLTTALRQHGIDPDIVALTDVSMMHGDYDRLLPSRIVIGETQIAEPPRIYRKPNLSGVTKDPNELHARPYVDGFTNEDERLSTQETINVARAYVDQMGSELFEAFQAFTPDE
jgi:hypothetical protein